MQSRLKIYRVVVILIAITLFSPCGVFADVYDASGDTLVLGCTNVKLTVSENNLVANASFDKNCCKKLFPKTRYYLQLENVTMPQSPDGAYEVYLVPSGNTPMLFPNSMQFITVLNTYTLSNKPQHVYIDITTQLTEAVKHAALSPSVYIMFSGNKLANNKESVKAGLLKTGYACIVSVRE